ncbi:MAG: Lrp/AsnC family transcriptional regulator [Candidatus Diapherotrites archaeon]|nr:Lrp/AsnC family transcriptional regulator [Candidatus Diapherotrites archaeon]
MIDNVDRKILYCLDINSRDPVKEIAKKAGLRSNVVDYRLKKLVDEKVITRMFAEVNISRIGFTAFKIYVQFQDITPELEKQFFEFISKHPNSLWGVRGVGHYAAIAGFVAKDVEEIEKIKNDFLGVFGKNILMKQVAVNTGYYIFNRKYLSKEFKLGRVYDFFSRGKKIMIDKKDSQIITLLLENSRIKAVDIAEKVGLSGNQVLMRIKKLQESGVIVSYKIDLNLAKIGYQFHKVLVYLQNYNLDDKKKLLDYCSNVANITALSDTIAPWDIEIEMETETTQQAMEIMSDIRNKFPNIAKSYETMIITKETGRNYKLPKESYKE